MSLISLLFLISIPNTSFAVVSTGACQAIATDAVAECSKIYDLKKNQCKISKVETGGVAADAAVKAELERCQTELQAVKALCEGRASSALSKCQSDQAKAISEKNTQVATMERARASEIEANDKWQNAKAREYTNPIPGTVLVDRQAQAEMVEAEGQIASARITQEEAQTQISQLEGVIADIDSFKDQVDAVRQQAVLEANRGKTVTANATRDIDKRTSEIGGGPTTTASDRGDGSQRTGTGADTKGQGSGQSGNQSDNQAGKKNDEGGGQGGGGGGGLPSPQSRADEPTPIAQPAQDCSNPQVASSNPVCACRQNPSDSRCRSILAENAGPAKKSDAEGGGSYGGGGAGGNTGTAAEAKAAQAKNISKHGQLEQGAGGSVGKGVGSGQGSGAAAGGKTANGKQANLRDNTASRSYGGRGGGSGGGGMGGSSIGGGNRFAPLLGASDPRNRRHPVAAKKRLTQEELRRQLQAQFNANRGFKRGPSGVVGPDGITGPHTDQFKKIRTRYADAFGL